MSLRDRLRKLSFGASRRVDFYRDLAAFDTAGLPTFRAIPRLNAIARRRGRRMRWLRDLTADLMRSAGRGRSLADAMRPWVPPEESALLEAGERSGQLRDALIECALIIERRRQIYMTLLAALIPSALMVSALLGLMAMIVKMVVPEARKLLPESEFAKLTLAPAFFTASDWFMAALPFVLGAVAIGGALTAATLSRWRPVGVRAWLDRRVPPWTLYVMVQASFLLVTLSAMMRAGTPMAQAVEAVQRRAAPWMRAHLRRILTRLAQGREPADALDAGVLPARIEDRLMVYAELPEFAQVMRAMSADAITILSRQMRAFGEVTRMLAMLGLAIFIALTLFSMGEVVLAAQSAFARMGAG